MTFSNPFPFVTDWTGGYGKRRFWEGARFRLRRRESALAFELGSPSAGRSTCDGRRIASLLTLVLLLLGVFTTRAAASDGGGENDTALSLRDVGFAHYSDTLYVARMDVLVVRPSGVEQRARRGMGGRDQIGDQRDAVSDASGPQSSGVRIGGFVMNETFSVVGSQFYAAFYNAWSEPKDVSTYTVRVREEPAPRFGARIIVEVGGTTLYRTFLRPNNGRVRKAAQGAVHRVATYLRKYHEPRTVY